MDRRAPLAVVRAFTRGGIFNMLTLGFQETDLTSASPMQRIRFAQSGLSQGVDRPLWAQVSLWQLEEARCALVAIDHIGFGLERGASLRARLAALLRCSPEQVMLCFSHTHAAPTTVCRRTSALYRLPPRRFRTCARFASPGGCGEVDIEVNRRDGKALIDGLACSR